MGQMSLLRNVKKQRFCSTNAEKKSQLDRPAMQCNVDVFTIKKLEWDDLFL